MREVWIAPARVKWVCGIADSGAVLKRPVEGSRMTAVYTNGIAPRRVVLIRVLGGKERDPRFRGTRPRAGVLDVCPFRSPSSIVRCFLTARRFFCPTKGRDPGTSSWSPLVPSIAYSSNPQIAIITPDHPKLKLAFKIGPPDIDEKSAAPNPIAIAGNHPTPTCITCRPVIRMQLNPHISSHELS